MARHQVVRMLPAGSALMRASQGDVLPLGIDVEAELSGG